MTKRSGFAVKITAFEDKDAPDPPDPNQMNLFSAPTKGE